MIISRKHIVSFIFLAVFSLIQVAIFSSLAHPALADNTLLNNQTGLSSDPMYGNQIGDVYGNQKIDIRVVIARIITIVLEFLAVIFLGLTLFAGFRYMTAAGNEEQTKKALSQITDAVIGLVVVIASWALVSFIIRMLSLAI